MQFRPTVGEEPASFDVLVEGNQYCFELSWAKSYYYKKYTDKRANIHNYRRYDIQDNAKKLELIDILDRNLNKEIRVGFAINK